MKVLIVKMSSLGDVLHTLPAIQDAARKIPSIQFHWLIEPAFQEVAAWHPAVKKIIPFPLRSLRKAVLRNFTNGTIRSYVQQLRAEEYDLIVDAQGLLKSALLSVLAKGPVYGLDHTSAREAWSSLLYKHRISVSKQQHAVVRLRELFARVFKYDFKDLPFDYGIDGAATQANTKRAILLLHGTTWSSKLWPLEHWIHLTKLIQSAKYQVLLPWGNLEEKNRALTIQAAFTLTDRPIVLEKMSLNGLRDLIQSVHGVVAVDTGLGHLTAALDKTCVSLYGSTNPTRTGTYGLNQIHLRVQKNCSPCFERQCPLANLYEDAPCYQTLTPSLVWDTLKKNLRRSSSGNLCIKV